MPRVTALTSSGSCDLTTTGAAGIATLTANYSTFTSAFGSATGTSLSATASHTILGQNIFAGGFE